MFTLHVPSRHELRSLVRAATLAPSGHNAQPWRFVVDGATVRVLPDLSRRLPVVDPDDHALWIGLGCAVENLAVAAAAAGWVAEVGTVGASGPSPAVAIRLAAGGGGGEARLAAAIPERQSTRSAYDGRALGAAHLRALEAAAARPGVALVLVEGAAMDPLADLAAEGSRRQFSDPAFVEELLAWIRFSRREVHERGDGLAAPVMGLPYVPRWLGARAMGVLTSPGSEAGRVAKAVRGSSALMALATDRRGPAAWLDLGRSFERAALAATAAGIRQAHVNMPCEVPDLRGELRAALGLGAGWEPLLLLRLGYGPARPRSPRRRLDDVLVETAPRA